VKDIDPERYGSTRNYVDGALTYLSPYISRGVLSTKKVFQHVQSIKLPEEKTVKLVQELAWRDYWQNIWKVKEEAILKDLKNTQSAVNNYQIPLSVIQANTGIHEVDKAIKQLYAIGYMHNHMRMYVASICCNIAHCHWLQTARWMYSHLLDGDLASNHLSWQWVAGAFSNKKYYANQKNINTYFKTEQSHTFLDIGYDQFESMSIPRQLEPTQPFSENTNLTASEAPNLDKNKTTLIYNYYNLDPYWYEEADVQRVLLLEPSFFSKYPVNNKCINFVLKLAANLDNVKVYVNEFSELEKQVNKANIVYKEHPTNAHYKGKEESRDWMGTTKGYYPSFFAFWKKYKKELDI
jgi:deoxyribodipyrimidine photo-lyase